MTHISSWVCDSYGAEDSWQNMLLQVGPVVQHCERVLNEQKNMHGLSWPRCTKDGCGRQLSHSAERDKGSKAWFVERPKV